VGEHGGRRPGAGRKKGTQSSKTKARLALVERLSAGAPTPLDVMLAAMEDALARGDMPAAAAFAKDAAPYMHPRLQAVVHTQNPTGKSELQELIEELDGTSRGLPDYTDASGEWGNRPPDSLDS
jgi:hypothetical protein